MDQMVVQKVTPAAFRIGHLALGAILRKGTVVLVRSGNARFDVRGKDVARAKTPHHIIQFRMRFVGRLINSIARFLSLIMFVLFYI